MENGSLGEDINPWGAAMFRRCRPSSSTRPSRRRPTASGWTRPRTGRKPARTASTAPPGVMPIPLWIALFFISAIVLVFLLGFADSGDRVWVQAHVHGQRRRRDRHACCCCSHFLDQPFHGGIGGLKPVAMERTEQLIDQQLAVIGGDVTIPCDDAGIPV